MGVLVICYCNSGINLQVWQPYALFAIWPMDAIIVIEY